MAEPLFDHLKMYFGEPYDVGNSMTITIPTVGDVLALENSDMTFYQTLYLFVCNPTSYRLMLWDQGIDWCKISDYELFIMIHKSADENVTHMLFGDVDFQGFQLYSKATVQLGENGEPQEVNISTLYNPETEVELSSEDYTKISEYLRAAFNIYPKVEKAKGRATKEAIIDEERWNLAARERNGENKPTSTLLPLISSCINHPGFKYKLEELRNVNFVQFMDSVQRLQIYENTRAMLAGSMSGFCDMSKVPKEEFNWMRDLAPTGKDSKK